MIQAFLSAPTQTAVLENEKSGTVPVHVAFAWCPSGFGPRPPNTFLKLLMTYQTGSNQRYSCSLMTHYSHLICSFQSASQQVMDRLHEWELQWNMEFNLSKCAVIHVTRARFPVLSDYLLHGQILESVGGSKYLDVEINDNVTIFRYITTPRRYAHQQACPLDS